MKKLQEFWSRCKQWRHIALGPLTIHYRLGRTVPVSSNLRRRLARLAQKLLLPPADEIPELNSSFASPPLPAATGRETALLVGTGPGLGFALAHKLAAVGMNVAVASRDTKHLDGLVEALSKAFPSSDQIIRAYGCDATDESSVKELMALVVQDFGVPHFMAYAAQRFVPGQTVAVEVCAFEESWRQNCLGAFIAAKETARLMVAEQRGTILLVGSTSSLIGRAEHLNLAAGKFGLRALAQVMARELWPLGIHVVHLIIDADIKENECFNNYIQTNPQDIASLIHALHLQPKSAWSSEVDIRPFNEKWWEHC